MTWLNGVVIHPLARTVRWALIHVENLWHDTGSGVLVGSYTAVGELDCNLEFLGRGVDSCPKGYHTTHETSKMLDLCA